MQRLPSKPRLISHVSGNDTGGLINVLQQTDNDCSHSNVSTFHTQFGTQTCFAKFASEFHPDTAGGGSTRLSLSRENKPKDGREALADEMFQNVLQSYLLYSWRKWLPVPDAKWVHSFNRVSRRGNRTDTSDKRLLTSHVNFNGWVDKTETSIRKNTGTSRLVHLHFLAYSSLRISRHGMGKRNRGVTEPFMVDSRKK